jgi:pimeloyl-ACP methyl ester carboxylesterase
MPQVDTHDGHHVIHTQYTDAGHGAPVVLLHGGLESGADWHDLAAALATTHRVLRPDRRGHGRTADVPGPYSYEAMARESMSFVERVAGSPAHWIGYSDGGSCALLAALARPDLVRSLVVISAHFHHDGILPAMVERFRHPDPDNPRLQPMRQAHAALAPEGDASWPDVYRKVCAMALQGPTLHLDDLQQIAVPTLVIAADDDVIDHHHTIELFEALPDARLAIVPGTSHLMAHEAPHTLQQLVQRFLEGDAPRRLMPMRTVRRAAA